MDVCWGASPCGQVFCTRLARWFIREGNRKDQIGRTVGEAENALLDRRGEQLPAGGFDVRGVRRLRGAVPRDAAVAATSQRRELAEHDAFVRRERFEASLIVGEMAVVAFRQRPLRGFVRVQCADLPRASKQACT